jgi:hypothetical protein
VTPITLERYRERSGRLDLTGIDLGAFARRPLSTGALRCLRYMHDIEHHTMCYLRDLLGTPAHRDPRITAFLSALNEWTTQAGSGRLASREGHPVLSDLRRRIMHQEGGRIDFYAAEAQRRLAASPAARRLASFALGHLWQPVGSGVMPSDEVAFWCRYLFDGDAGQQMAARIDRRVEGLPGLGGLHRLAQAVDGRRAA